VRPSTEGAYSERSFKERSFTERSFTKRSFTMRPGPPALPALAISKEVSAPLSGL